jgi:hypothetical protein
MPPSVQVGAILIEPWPAMTKLFGIESEPYSGSWSVVKAINGFALDRKIHAAGWNFFFMAVEVNVVFLGARDTDKIHSALTRILGKVREQNFNCVEVTAIVAKRFLGVPYTMVSAHSRHIQQSVYLDSTNARRA